MRTPCLCRMHARTKRCESRGVVVVSGGDVMSGSRGLLSMAHGELLAALVEGPCLSSMSHQTPHTSDGGLLWGAE